MFPKWSWCFPPFEDKSSWTESCSELIRTKLGFLLYHDNHFMIFKLNLNRFNYFNKLVNRWRSKNIPHGPKFITNKFLDLYQIAWKEGDYKNLFLFPTMAFGESFPHKCINNCHFSSSFFINGTDWIALKFFLFKYTFCPSISILFLCP